MSDYIEKEWNDMVLDSHRQLNGTCPLIEDEVIIAIDDKIQRLEAKVKYLKEVIKGGLHNDQHLY